MTTGTSKKNEPSDPHQAGDTDECPSSDQLCSPSPDELALINAAKYYGIKFLERNQYNEIIIENDHHQQSQVYKFELLNIIEFNSDRKRMTVIVKAPNGEIKVLCKGSDSVLIPLLSDSWENQ